MPKDKTISPVVPPPENPPPPEPSSDLKRVAATLVHAACDALYALEQVPKTDSNFEDSTALAGHIAGALLEAGGRLTDAAGTHLRQSVQMPSSRDPYQLATQVMAGILASLRQGERDQKAGHDNSLPMLRRLAEVLPQHKHQRTALSELETLSRQDESRRQALCAEEHTRRMGIAARKALHAKIRGVVPNESTETTTIIEVDAPKGTMGNIPVGRGDLDPNPLDEVEVPRVS